MASFNGLQLKNYKKVGVGHEGYIFSGTLYLNGKKLGTTTTDSWGGPDIYDFDTRVLKEIVSRYNERFGNGLFEMDLDCLVGFLDELNDLEKKYKKATKDRPLTLVWIRTVFDGLGLMTSVSDEQKILNSKAYADVCKELDNRMSKSDKILSTEFYHGLDDFNIVIG